MTSGGRPRWGSDVVVEMLRLHGVRYVPLNLGSTFRGVLDSLLGYGQGGPEVIECLHEEVAVSIAHGYAQATDTPSVALVHNVVGTLHASMAIYDAYVARAPVVVLSGAGPMSVVRRRPRIDWIHSALVQGDLVRDYVKWDDQPNDLESFPESFMRACRVAMTEPKGPVYIGLDAAWQEEELARPLVLPDVDRYAAPTRMQADPEALDHVARMLVDAELPLIVAGRVGRDPRNVARLIRLAEAGGIAVMDGGGPLNFPNTHALDASRTGLLGQADVVLLLEVDQAEAALSVADRYTREIRSRLREGARVASIGTSEVFIRSTALDFGRLYPTEISVLGDPSLVIPELERRVTDLLRTDTRRAQLLAERRRRCADARAATKAAPDRDEVRVPTHELLSALANALAGLDQWIVAPSEPWRAAGGLDAIRADLRLERPGCVANMQGAGALGTFVAKTIGVGLAAKEHGGIAIGLGTDGDLLYTPMAIWTAVHHRVPVLLIVRDNGGYRGEGEHMAWMARSRERSLDRVDVATTFDRPAVDLNGIAAAQGAHTGPPIEDSADLGAAIERAIEAVRGGTLALVTVR